MYDIGFIILNYNLYHETIECVKSIIKNIDTPNYIIAIVDNASTNGYGERLLDYYKSSEKVIVIKNADNIGYANGNNVGIDYIMNNLNGAKFLCCINNDTLIEQRNYYDIINSIYRNDNTIAVIGVRVYDELYYEGRACWNLLDAEDYKNIIEYYKRKHRKPRIILSENPIKKNLLKINMIYDLNNLRRRIEKDILRIVNRKRNRERYYRNINSSENLIDKNDGEYDVVTHGCCVIFTPAFFSKLKGFDPETFMYGEEDILYVDVIGNGLHTFKSSALNILHYGEKSTDTAFDNYEKEDFRMRQVIKSLRILIDKMWQYGSAIR